MTHHEAGEMPPLCTWLWRDEQVFWAENVGTGAPERAQGLGSCAELVGETVGSFCPSL